MLNDIDIVLLLLFCILLKKKTTQQQQIRHRRWYVRPLNLERTLHGHYNTIFSIMRNNDQEQFFKYTRMTVVQFKKLFDVVGPHLERKKNHSLPISSEERLLITL